MMGHKTKLIVNPSADKGRTGRKVEQLQPVVEGFGGADIIATVYPKHAIEIARQVAEAGCSLVIAAGGDGTVHEVINGLMQVPQEIRPRLGIIPLGSGNDFAHLDWYSYQPGRGTQTSLFWPTQAHGCWGFRNGAREGVNTSIIPLAWVLMLL